MTYHKYIFGCGLTYFTTRFDDDVQLYSNGSDVTASFTDGDSGDALQDD